MRLDSLGANVCSIVSSGLFFENSARNCDLRAYRGITDIHWQFLRKSVCKKM